MSDRMGIQRRGFLRGAATGAGFIGLNLALGCMAAPAKSAGSPALGMARLNNVNAGVLNIAYYEAGPADGPAVVLLHGFPYDIEAYAEVAPLLASAGCRVIVPYLRGFGPTRFLQADTPRSGELAVNLAKSHPVMGTALLLASAALAGTFVARRVLSPGASRA